MITNDDEIKSAAQIVEIISDFVTLQKKGVNYMGCCPFHAERTPSFTVSETKGIFKCFGCGKGGDAVTFIREQNKLNYVEALRYIAGKYNIEVKESEEGLDVQYSEKTQAKSTAAVVQAHFATQDFGLQYWKDRGFTDETLDEFGIGFCDGSKPAHVPDADLAQVGILNEKGNLTMYRRSTIPLHDRNGAIIGWAGRTLEDDNKAKYINISNTILFNKSTHLFNLHRASRHIKSAQEVWIVEGYADVMAAWQCGVKNVVGLCGTALTESHVNQLRRFNGDTPLRIVLALDNEIIKTTDDEEGRTFKAAVATAYFTAMERLLPLGEVQRFIYPKPKGKRYKDIADIVKSNGNPATCEKVDALSDYVQRRLAQDDWAQKASPVEKADFQEHVARLLSLIKRDSVRDVYIKEISELIFLSPKKFGELVSKYGTDKDQDVAYDILEYEYIIIKDEFRQRYPEFSTGGETVWRYQTIKKSTITDQFGTAFIKTLPRFTKSIIEPDHLNYQRTYSKETEHGTYRYFNDYEPLPVTPKPFTLPEAFIKNPYVGDYTDIPEIKNIASLFKHIFDSGKNTLGDDFLQIAWDWLAVMYLHPRDRLPAIGIVSKEEGTGKSTLINVLAKFFGANATKIDSSRIAAKFNALMGGKVLVYCEETKDDRGQMENILKDLITGFEAVIEKKFGDAEVVPTFCKFLFASNHPDTFMKIGSKSTRFFINEVSSIPANKKEPNFEEKCYMELPYLAYFLQQRGIMIEQEDRLWFKPERYENEALYRLRQVSKDNVERNLEDLIETIFLGLQWQQPYLFFTSKDIMQMMIAHAGRKYETHTLNYFQDVAVRMGINYTTTTRRTILEIKGLYNGVITSEVKPSVQGRFLEFPIWQFCQPDQIHEIYTPQQKAALYSNIKAFQDKNPGTVPADWFDAVFSNPAQYAGKQDEMPF